MALRTVPEQHTFDLFRTTHNILAADVGDLSALTTAVNSSIVACLNNLEDQIDGITLGAFSLANDTWFVAGAFGGGNQNVFKVNNSNKIEFGAPIQNVAIESGTLALTSPLAITSGGTGAITAAAARTALGLTIGTNVQAWNANLDTITNITHVPATVTFMVSNGSLWGNFDAQAVRTTLGLQIGSTVQAWDVNLDQLAALIPTADTFVAGNGASWVNRDAASVRSILGLVIGNPSTAPSGTVQGYSPKLHAIGQLAANTNDIIIGSSGTFVSASGATARSALGLSIGSNVQAWDVNLDQIAALVPAQDTFIVGNSGGAWTLATRSQAQAALQLVPGTHVQAQSTNLQQISTLTGLSANNFIVYDTTVNSWKKVTPSEAQFAIGLRPGIEVQAFSTSLQNISSVTPNAGWMLVATGSGYTLVPAVPSQESIGNTLNFLEDYLKVRVSGFNEAATPNVQGYSAILDALISGAGTGNDRIPVTAGGTWTTKSYAQAALARSGVNTDITALSSITTIMPAVGSLQIGPTNTFSALYFNAGNSTAKLVFDGQNLSPIADSVCNLGSSGNNYAAIYGYNAYHSFIQMNGSTPRIAKVDNNGTIDLCASPTASYTDGGLVKVQGSGVSAAGIYPGGSFAYIGGDNIMLHGNTRIRIETSSANLVANQTGMTFAQRLRVRVNNTGSGGDYWIYLYQ